MQFLFTDDVKESPRPGSVWEAQRLHGPCSGARTHLWEKFCFESVQLSRHGCTLLTHIHLRKAQLCFSFFYLSLLPPLFPVAGGNGTKRKRKAVNPSERSRWTWGRVSGRKRFNKVMRDGGEKEGKSCQGGRGWSGGSITDCLEILQEKVEGGELDSIWQL